MDTWIGLCGVALGAVIAGGATYLNNKGAEVRARAAQRREDVAHFGAEFLREADDAAQYLMDRADGRQRVPDETEPDGVTVKAGQSAVILGLYAPRAVGDAASDLVGALSDWESGEDKDGRDVLDAYEHFVTALRVYLHGADD